MPEPPAAVTSSAVSSMVSETPGLAAGRALALLPRTAAGAVNGRTSFAERYGDATAGAARGSGYERDLALKSFVVFLFGDLGM